MGRTQPFQLCNRATNSGSALLVFEAEPWYVTQARINLLVTKNLLPQPPEVDYRSSILCQIPAPRTQHTLG